MAYPTDGEDVVSKVSNDPQIFPDLKKMHIHLT